MLGTRSAAFWPINVEALVKRLVKASPAGGMATVLDDELLAPAPRAPARGCPWLNGCRDRRRAGQGRRISSALIGAEDQLESPELWFHLVLVVLAIPGHPVLAEDCRRLDGDLAVAKELLVQAVDQAG